MSEGTKQDMSELERQIQYKARELAKEKTSGLAIDLTRLVNKRIGSAHCISDAEHLLGICGSESGNIYAIFWRFENTLINVLTKKLELEMSQRAASILAEDL